MTSTIEATIDAVASAVITAKYIAFATLVLCIYEYIITLDEEIPLLWSSRRNAFVKGVFAANRYAPFIISTLFFYSVVALQGKFELCKPLALLLSYMSCISTAAAGSVISMRVYIMWERKKSILIFMLSIFILTTVTTFVLLYWVFLSEDENSARPYGSGCEIYFPDRRSWILYLIVFIQEIILLSLVIMKYAKFCRNSTMKLTRVLVQDGVFYYVYIMAATLANILIITLAPRLAPYYLAVPQAVMHNILCIRLSNHLIAVHEASVLNISSGRSSVIGT